MVRGTQELKEKFFSFIITDEEVNKTNYLQTLCRQMALAVRVADAVSYILFTTIYLLHINPQTIKSIENRFRKLCTVNFVGRKATNFMQVLPHVMLLIECWQKCLLCI